MKTKLITKVCLTEFYYLIVNFVNLIFSKNMTLVGTSSN